MITLLYINNIFIILVSRKSFLLLLLSLTPLRATRNDTACRTFLGPGLDSRPFTNHHDDLGSTNLLIKNS